jgi:hypothetical protein
MMQGKTETNQVAKPKTTLDSYQLQHHTGVYTKSKREALLPQWPVWIKIGNAGCKGHKMKTEPI